LFSRRRFAGLWVFDGLWVGFARPAFPGLCRPAGCARWFRVAAFLVGVVGWARGA